MHIDVIMLLEIEIRYVFPAAATVYVYAALN